VADSVVAGWPWLSKSPGALDPSNGDSSQGEDVGHETTRQRPHLHGRMPRTALQPGTKAHHPTRRGWAQPVSNPGLIDELTREHRELERWLDEFARAITAPQATREMAVAAYRQVWPRAAAHLAKEEDTFYAGFLRFDPEFAAKMLEQHQMAREVARWMEDLLQRQGPTSPEEQTRELFQAARLLHALLQHHLIEEERSAFPRFPGGSSHESER